jgi:5-methyltetrahydropteroyltriglutamate--homocysteine methyltransferase
MALSNVAGFPRIGPKRELKFALESHWRGEASEEELLAVAKRIRLDNWRVMQSAGIDLIPSNDFSLYDHVLDTSVMVGAIPRSAAGPADRCRLKPISRWRAAARGTTTTQPAHMARMGMRTAFPRSK